MSCFECALINGSGFFVTLLTIPTLFIQATMKSTEVKELMSCMVNWALMTSMVMGDKTFSLVT